MTEMIKNEDVHVMEPHSEIQSESSITPPPSTSPGPGFIRPESRKRKQTCSLPNSQQDVMGLERSSPSSGYMARNFSTVEAIKAKYGRIDKDCILKTGFVKERIVCDIGHTVQQLNKKKINELELENGILKTVNSIVADAETLNIDIQWLRSHLDEIREAITANKEAKQTENRRSECMKRVEQNKETLKRLKIQMEKQLNEDISQAEILGKSINALTTEFQNFQQKGLTDGLL